MRQVNLSNYNVRVANNQRVARFKEKECICGLEMVMADPVNPKVQDTGSLTGECPRCGQVQSIIIPDYLELPYDTKDSIIEMLLSRQNQIGAAELLERDKIARKMLDCTDGHVLLEEEEWKKLVKAVNTIRGLGKPDVQCVRYILEAEEVKVEEKK